MANNHCATSSHANMRSVEQWTSWRCASKRVSARSTTASAAAVIVSIAVTETLMCFPPSMSSVVRLYQPDRSFVLQRASENGRIGPVGVGAVQQRHDPLPPEAVAFVAAGGGDSAAKGELCGRVVENHRAGSLHAETFRLRPPDVAGDGHAGDSLRARPERGPSELRFLSRWREEEHVRVQAIVEAGDQPRQ